jgi:hypothetical protein
MAKRKVSITMATIKQILAMSAAERDSHNERILSTLKGVPCAATEFHAAQLKGWQVKLCGPKPTAEMVALNYILDGGRRAGNEPMWLAMTSRANGATVGEFMRATSAGGAAHNNAAKYNTERGGAGWLVRVPLPNTDRAGRWQHVITDKGEAQLAKRVAALTGAAAAKPVNAEKPAKVAAAVKVARKRNKAPLPAAAETPTSDAPAATEATTSLPATVEAIAALADHFNA